MGTVVLCFCSGVVCELALAVGHLVAEHERTSFVAFDLGAIVVAIHDDCQASTTS